MRSSVGSKREIRDGVWQVRVSVGYRRDGTQRVVSRTVHGTAQDADAEIVSIRASMGLAPSVGTGTTLDDYFWGVFSPDRHATTTSANAKTYDTIFRRHISGTLGAERIERITRQQVKAWILTLPAQSAPSYVRALRAILSQARFDGYIERSPMDGVSFRMPRGRDTTPRPVWGAREVKDALSRDDFRRSQLFPLWCVMAGAGLSRSEALAIDWEGIGWDSALGMDGETHWTAYVRVDGAVTATDGEKGPKNSRRYRTVPLPPLFADALHEVRGTGPICQSRRHTGDGWEYTGKRLTPSYVPKRWKALFDKGQPLEGLPFVWLNRMRATYATLLQASGVDSTMINAMQGRSQNSQVLYSNYLAPGGDAFADASRRMQGRVAGA